MKIYRQNMLKGAITSILLVLGIPCGLILIGHYYVVIEDLNIQWSSSSVPIFNICERVDKEDVDLMLNRLREETTFKFSVAEKDQFNCVCSKESIPPEGVIEIYGATPESFISEETGNVSVSTGRAYLFPYSDRRMLRNGAQEARSACIRVIPNDDKNYSRRLKRLSILHEAIHGLGKGHAYLFGNPNTPDLLHVMSKEVCTLCNSLRKL